MIQSSESIKGAGRRPSRLARPNMEQIVPAVKDVRTVSERDLPSPLTPIPGARRFGRNMQPARQNDKSPYSLIRNNMVTDENKNEVAGMGNSDWHPGGGNMSDLHLQGGVEGLHPERVSSTVAAKAAVDAFMGHIVGRAGLPCDPGKVSAVRDWHAPGSVKQVRQFVGFIGYYRRFIQDFAGLSEPLVAWTDVQQITFDTLKACLLKTPIGLIFLHLGKIHHHPPARG